MGNVVQIVFKNEGLIMVTEPNTDFSFPKAAFDILKNVKCKDKLSIIGIYVYLAQLPEGSKFNRIELRKEFMIGETRLNTLISALSKNGLLEFIPQKNDRGRYSGSIVKLKMPLGQFEK